MGFDFGRNKYRKEEPLRAPWLVQRCKSREFKPDLRSSEYLDLDYMGAAEFEWGALPEWQREMASKLDRLTIRLVEHSGMTLYVMCEDHQLDEYAQMVRDLIDNKTQTKMGTRISARETRWTKPKKKGGRETPIFDDSSMPYSFDVWWDITNGLAFARRIDVLNNLKVCIKNSVAYMNAIEKKAK